MPPHDKSVCPVCGATQEIIVMDTSDGHTILECATECLKCLHEDYWAYGYFQNKAQNMPKKGDTELPNATIPTDCEMPSKEHENQSSVYKPLRILMSETRGISWSMKAMRKPMGSIGDTGWDDIIGSKDLVLASNLVKSGNDHAKAMRGIVVWLEIELQVGFMIEFETYRHGVECLSTSSSMHKELKKMKGPILAEQKQKDLPEKVYTRTLTMSYQALRGIYKARYNHRHPDWLIFCDWIRTLPYAKELIII